MIHGFVEGQNFYNILDDDEAATISSATTVSTKRTRILRNSLRHFDAVKVEENGAHNVTLPELMNTIIREKLQIIPASVR